MDQSLYPVFPVKKPGNESEQHYRAKMKALDWLSSDTDISRTRIAPEVKLDRGRPDLLKLKHVFGSKPKIKFEVHAIEVELHLGNINSWSTNRRHYRISNNITYPDLLTLIIPEDLEQDVLDSSPASWQIATFQTTSSSRETIEFNWVRRRDISPDMRSRDAYDDVKRLIGKAWEKFGRRKLGEIQFGPYDDL